MNHTGNFEELYIQLKRLARIPLGRESFLDASFMMRRILIDNARFRKTRLELIEYGQMLLEASELPGD